MAPEWGHEFAVLVLEPGNRVMPANPLQEGQNHRAFTEGFVLLTKEIMRNVESHTNDHSIEREIVAKGKTAPRITQDHINQAIKSAHYFTAEEAVLGTMPEDATPISHACPDALSLLTFCVLVLQNGFTVTGESACASPANFDAEIGKKIAFENAKQKIWLLEGYLLKSQLAAA